MLATNSQSAEEAGPSNYANTVDQVHDENTPDAKSTTPEFTNPLYVERLSFSSTLSNEAYYLMEKMQHNSAPSKRKTLRPSLIHRKNIGNLEELNPIGKNPKVFETKD
uniref:Uncharacterized protein n=1 Tax=Leersia perrieri TaxID=77586 RepID=A0A0D9V2P6_9ORYZ